MRRVRRWSEHWNSSTRFSIRQSMHTRLMLGLMGQRREEEDMREEGDMEKEEDMVVMARKRFHPSGG